MKLFGNGFSVGEPGSSHAPATRKTIAVTLPARLKTPPLGLSALISSIARRLSHEALPHNRFRSAAIS